MSTLKKWIVIVSTAMLSLGMVAPVMAKGKKAKAGASGKSGKHGSKFEKADANHNGEITFEEFQTSQDLKKAGGKPGGKKGKAGKGGKAGKEKKAGKTGKGNGKSMTLQQRFDRGDSDHDGKITMAEWDVAKAKKSGGNGKAKKAGKGGKGLKKKKNQ